MWLPSGFCCVVVGLGGCLIVSGKGGRGKTNTYGKYRYFCLDSYTQNKTMVREEAQQLKMLVEKTGEMARSIVSKNGTYIE